MLEPTKDAFEEFEAYEDFTDLKTDQLLTEVWLKPKKVFAYIFKHEPKKYVQPLLWIAAFASALNRGLEKGIINFSPQNIGFLLGSIIGGGLLTFLLYYVFAWFLKFFGNAFLKGTASSEDYRTVIAWGNIPVILSVVTTLILVVIYGPTALAGYQPESYAASIVFILAGLISFGLAIWSIVIMVSGIMHIQKFTVWKAIGNLFLPFIILVMVFVIVFVLGDLIGN